MAGSSVVHMVYGSASKHVWRSPWPSIVGVGCDLVCVVEVEDKCERFMGDGPMHGEGMNK
jgi:hypothetical protein